MVSFEGIMSGFILAVVDEALRAILKAAAGIQRPTMPATKPIGPQMTSHPHLGEPT